jgi:hypothetical protein
LEFKPSFSFRDFGAKARFDVANVASEFGYVCFCSNAFGECGFKSFGGSPGLFGRESAVRQAVDIGQGIEKNLGRHDSILSQCEGDGEGRHSDFV